MLLEGGAEERDGTGSRDVQQRLESSSVGRKVIGILVVLTLASMLASVITHPLVGREARTLFRPYYAVTGLNQNWGVFAPDPRSTVLDTYARLSYDDDSSEKWRPVSGGPWISPYRDYRWHKLFEKASAGGNAELHESATRWVARTQADPGRLLREVRLVHRWAPIPPPGGAPEPWTEDVLYVLEVSTP